MSVREGVQLRVRHGGDGPAVVLCTVALWSGRDDLVELSGDPLAM